MVNPKTNIWKNIVSAHRNDGGMYLPALPRGRPSIRKSVIGGLPGRHLIADFRGALHLDDLGYIESAVARAIGAAGATLLTMNFHVFDPGGGITGTASLAESHISIHTWPENAYAAIDIFMCGICDPLNALPTLVEAFVPALVNLCQIVRGAPPQALTQGI